MIFTMLQNEKWNSKVPKDKITTKEKILGYLIGPGGMLLLNAVIGGYLNKFYTDTLTSTFRGWGWTVSELNIWTTFLVIMPIVTEVLDALTNLIFGWLIDKTKSIQGKARPWLLLTAPLALITGILAFVVIKTNNVFLELAWIAITYNLYYCLTYTIYNLSHNLMVPLSTRDVKQRDTLAMFSNAGACMIPGAFVSALFPFIVIPIVGYDDPNKWLIIAIIFSVLSFPCILLEYFNTRERITEDTQSNETNVETVSMKQQFVACNKSRYWVIIVILQSVGVITNAIALGSRLYYCGWVLAESYEQAESAYFYLNVIGQAPLGFGIFLVYPLIRKFGKRNCILIGSIISAIGGTITCIFATNFALVMVGFVISSIGGLATTYAGSAMLADAMDHVEYKTKIRVDGFTIALYSIFVTISDGIGKSILNGALSLTGYYQYIENYGTIRNYTSANLPDFAIAFIILSLGMPVLTNLLYVLFLPGYKLDKEMPQIKKELEKRHHVVADSSAVNQ